MTKTSKVIYALLAVACGVLLFLWYYLGFYLVDSPLDLIVAIVWWALIAVGVWAVVRANERRCERVRTVYVGEARTSSEDVTGAPVPAVFNPEKGLVELDGRSAQDATYALLQDLEYGFGRQEFPEGEAFTPAYMVRTREFEPEQKSAEGESVKATWRGEVVKPEGDRAVRWAFETPEQLGQILSTM